MSRIQKKGREFRTFFEEVFAEMKKSTWPERKELVDSTVVVIVSVLMLSVFVGISDKLLVTVLKLLIPSG